MFGFVTRQYSKIFVAAFVAVVGFTCAIAIPFMDDCIILLIACAQYIHKIAVLCICCISCDDRREEVSIGVARWVCFTYDIETN